MNFFYAINVLYGEAKRIRDEQNPLDQHDSEDSYKYAAQEANARSCEIGAKILDAVHAAARIIKELP